MDKKGGAAVTEEEMMAQALEQAYLALAEGETPVGCVIAKKGRIIARGRNRRETEKDPTAHAEMEAIRAAARATGDWRLTGCELYVTLEPCPMCAGAIVQARLARVVYGAADPRQGCTGSVYRVTEDPAFTHFCPADGGVLEKECRAVLDEFFKNARHGR